jgi:hypothetical protein
MFWKKKPIANQGNQEKAPFLIAWRTEDSGMTVNIDPSQIENPGAAGLILADLYRHFARALAQTDKSQSEEHASAEMIAMFLAELKSPTDEGFGTIARN